MRSAVRKLAVIGTCCTASQRSFSAGLALHSSRKLASLAPSAGTAPWAPSCCPLTTPPRRFKSSGSIEHAGQTTSSEHPDAKTQVNPTKDIPRQDQFSSAAQEDILQLPASQKATSQPLGQIQRRLSLTFTCTVADCGHRSSHEFSRHAYEKGIVLVQCPNCETRHLIADHLGWFDSDDLTQGGKYRTIEALMQAKGESVSRARVLSDGTVEIDDEQP